MMRTLITLVLAILLAACNGEELERLRAENAGLEEQASTLTQRLDDYRTALEEANQVISEAEDDISEAQVYVDGACGDLRFLVATMDTPEQVDEPY